MYNLVELAALNAEQQIAHMNTIFQRQFGDALPGSYAAEKQFDYYLSEYDELKSHLGSGFVSDEIRDDIGDMLTTILGTAWRAGFDLPAHNWIRDHDALAESPDNFNGEKSKEMQDRIAQLTDELKKVFVEKDVWDASYLHDQLFVLTDVIYRWALHIGIPVHTDLSLVTASNLSKVCNGKACLERTYEKYNSIGVELRHEEVEPDVYVVFSAKQQTGTDGKVYDDNKFLKSVDFYEPVFPSLSRESALARVGMVAAAVQHTPTILLDAAGNELKK